MNVKTNLIDKIISFFNPSEGLKRAQTRAAIEVITQQKKRGYEGARLDRRTAGWLSGHDSSNVNEREAVILKNRSRDLYRNNPYSYRAHNSIANNTTGIGIVPAIKNESLKKIWKGWAKSINVDVDGLHTFYSMQNLVMRTMSMHGEVIILRIRTEDNELPLKLKVINTRFLDSMKDTFNADNGGAYVESGIEYDKQGKKLGYWIFPRDPLTYDDKSVFWDAKDVIHLFFQDEPGQSRGVPFGSSSMMSLRDFDDYADAQLMRQKVAACFSIFITKNDTDLSGEGNNLYSTDGNDVDYVEPGTIQHLEPGKSVTFASPPPAEGYAEYSRNVLTGVASGYGMTYEAMTGDLSNVNYSSGRMGRLEYQRMIEIWQHHIIIPRFCNVVWIWFLEAVKLINNKELIKEDKIIEWTAPGFKMIDPVKEVKGLVDQVRAGFMSWQEAVRKLGYSPEEIIQEMKAAKVLFDDAQLQPSSDPRYDAQKVVKEMSTLQEQEES